MNFTVETIARSLASYLAPIFPDVTFYENPNQQEKNPPYMLLQQSYAKVKPQLGDYGMKSIGFNLTYLVQNELPDMQRRYEKAADTLDEMLETFPYTDGESEEQTLLRTYEREWNMEQDALHYKFEIRPRVLISKKYEKMKSIQEYHEEVKR